MFTPSNLKAISLEGYKEFGKKISFADLAVSKSLEYNRSLNPGGISDS